jgi:GTPase SAR1 family protein
VPINIKKIGFSQVRKGYYMGAQGAILVFDLTHHQPFKNLHNWIQEILKNKGEPLQIILVGNKADLKSTTANDLSAEEIDRFRGELEEWSGSDVTYIEASALTGLNVEDIFENIVEPINMHISMSQGKHENSLVPPSNVTTVEFEVQADAEVFED